jgi:endonuclease/exonuclease/phosphatase family metal-dependent hydrolase
VKIATYNIQRGRGLDFARRIERAIDVLRAIDADVIGLQEVVVDPEGAHGDQGKAIADALGMHHRFAGARPHGSGRYGVAVLSRTPIGETRVHDVSVPRCERRIVLEAAVGRMRVFVCHFGLGPRERQRQANALRKILAASPKPRIALGDFNEWTHGAVAHALEAELGAIPKVKTHPAALPLLPLDRIYSDVPFETLEAHRASPAHVASDHLPLIAVI